MLLRCEVHSTTTKKMLSTKFPGQPEVADKNSQKQLVRASFGFYTVQIIFLPSIFTPQLIGYYGTARNLSPLNRAALTFKAPLLRLKNTKRMSGLKRDHSFRVARVCVCFYHLNKRLDKLDSLEKRLCLKIRSEYYHSNSDHTCEYLLSCTRTADKT